MSEETLKESQNETEVQHEDEQSMTSGLGHQLSGFIKTLKLADISRLHVSTYTIRRVTRGDVLVPHELV